MPNLTIMAPQDGAELEAMMELAAKLDVRVRSGIREELHRSWEEQITQRN